LFGFLLFFKRKETLFLLENNKNPNKHPAKNCAPTTVGSTFSDLALVLVGLEENRARGTPNPWKWGLGVGLLHSAWHWIGNSRKLALSKSLGCFTPRCKTSGDWLNHDYGVHVLPLYSPPFSEEVPRIVGLALALVAQQPLLRCRQCNNEVQFRLGGKAFRLNKSQLQPNN